MRKALMYLSFLPVVVFLLWLAVYVATGFNAFVPGQWEVLSALSLAGTIVGCLMIGGWPAGSPEDRP